MSFEYLAVPEMIMRFTAIEAMILITLFMELMPVFTRMRSIESKVNEIQYNLAKTMADIENLNHAYSLKDIKGMVEQNNKNILDVIKFLNKNNGFKIRENNQIKYLDYDP